MKIWHISDTHGYHNLLEVPPNIDIVIHTGDTSNYHDVYRNEPESRDFLNWYAALDIKHKVLIAGNHDAFACLWNKGYKELCNILNITYLENESVAIEGLNIWGSPYSPNFGNWHFMKARHKLHKLWTTIPLDTDIVLTHTPPQGILDVSYKRDHTLENCGCSALRKVLDKVKPKYSMFGHIHNNDGIVNAGTRTVGSAEGTIFSNGSVVTDRKFGKLSSNGNIFVVDK